MKTLTLLSILLSAHMVFAAPPVKSKEDLEFLPKGKEFFVDLGETKEFAGILMRRNETEAGLKKADLYEFRDDSKMKMDKALCTTMVSKMFGPLSEITLKLNKMELFDTKTGPACEVQLNDPDKQALIPERHIVVGFLNTKPRAVVFRLPKKSTPQTQENIRDFWKGLR